MTLDVSMSVEKDGKAIMQMDLSGNSGGTTMYESDTYNGQWSKSPKRSFEIDFMDEFGISLSCTASHEELDCDGRGDAEGATLLFEPAE